MAGDQNPRRSVYAALAANLAIFLAKSAAAVISGSSAMLAEAIHSLADTGNQALLLLGLRRAEKPPDELHPFGHGKERFFWTFVVAMSLFSLGAAFSIFHGIEGLVKGHEVPNPTIALIVLVLSALFEGSAFRTAWGQFQAKRGDRSVPAALEEAKDPEVLTVIGEDSAELTGIAIAIAGLLLANFTGEAAFDSAASIGIGIVLAVVAFLLAREMLNLLLGESASEPVRREIVAITQRSDDVDHVVDLRTMHIGPADLLIAMDVLFNDGLDTDGIEAAIDRIEDEIRSAIPEARAIFVEPETPG